MSTYAALVSLLQILRTIVGSGRDPIYNSVELQSIYEKVILLLDFLENSSFTYEEASQISAAETKMREAAYKAEDLIESQKSRIIDDYSRGWRCGMNSILFVFLCVLNAILNKIPVRPPKVILDRIKIFFVDAVAICLAVAVVLHMFILKKHYFEITDSRAQETQDLRLVLNDLDVIVKDMTRTEEAEQLSSYAALISLQRTLDSILDSGGYKHNRAQLKSLQQKVSLLLPFLENVSTYIATQNSADATIRDAVYKARSIIEFQIPTHFNVDLAKRCYRRTMSFWFLTICSFVITMCIWIGIHIWPLESLPQVAPELLPLMLRFYVINTILCAASALVSGPHKFSTEIYISERPDNEELCLIINHLGEILDKIKDACGNPSNLPPAAASSSSRRRLGGTRKNVLVGLESDIEQIRDLLTRDPSQRITLSIVGMGGIGKTTLAGKVYNDLAPNFDIRAWVTVSQEYSLSQVLLCLLNSANVFTKEMQEDDENKLGLHLYQSLMNRRYLIVMDDVWETKIWDSISLFFPENHNGSCVLMTSRLSNVASYINSSSPIHQIQCLNEDDSWYLLREKVFGGESCPLELESIGREIARSCGGLPLAIVVIGGLLYKQNQKNIWRDVAENLNSNLRQTEEECLEILGLSYKHLPHHLRPCFLYMGIFTRDCEIPVSRLIRLWVAEGFLRPCASKSLEEVAEDCLQDLIDRNLIFVCKSSCNGKIRTCNIHDLLRVVSLQKARDENFLDVVRCGGYLTQESHGRTVRRLSIDPDALQVNAGQDLISSCNYLRSFLCIASKPIKDSSVVYLGFLYLRVLDVLEVHFCEFPDQIVKLVHLRYLAFHCDGLLSPSMSKLQELETLVYHHCSFHKYPLLPWVIWSMPNLRHLYVKPGCHLSAPLCYRVPRNSFILEHLQTLMGIRNFKWSKDIIRRIPKLKKLGISYYVSCSVDWSMYQLECLVDLNQLETLKITITYDNLGSDISCDPPKLAFPHKLKKLALSGCGIPWVSMRMIGALSNLEALKLRCEACSGRTWETVEGEFPQLKFLLLEKMRFELWETDENHFPRLQRLVIRSCEMLEEIPSAIGDIPTLEMIELVDCLPSAVDSAQRIQEDQEDMGNDDLKVRIGLTSHIL